MTVETPTLPPTRSFGSLINNPVVRGIFIQLVLVVGLIGFVWWIVDNTSRNLAQAHIASGFGFLDRRSGFDISQQPIDYSSNATYARAILVGVVNTLIIAGTGIAMATVLGFIVGIGRLSRNFLLRGLATVYVETFRNIPPLLVILFWYFGVLAVLPMPRQAVSLPFGAFISNRGLQTPRVAFEEIAWISLAALAVGVVVAIVLYQVNRRRQMATGERRRLLWPMLGLIVGLPVVAFLVTGMPAALEFPAKSTFNLVGGFQIRPEFLALFLALSVYTGAFIAEIVRAGILSVSKGQTEAAQALGLSRRHTLRLVVVPQAFRVIIPPLTSQYLNLTKNSSLALAIGYPDLFAIGSTVLNQSGQSVEIIIICMLFYLTFSLIVSAFMNWFNAKMALVER
ncbi:amino acid ABC transporter permease [Consotaella salsifontis]|uniref:General L-amino acid ABC transporter membrane protein n=1 Tax=Consotaella salsifontis TaxID=1365950 RepID=A0A1T4L6G6_9HYPH|nr:amino acid ABC transporter permease [Consotaella salsifontis]SJZ50295.1 general L-amino acid ABC transporter membrane protein [Consotaella salsifontis]